MKDLKNADYIYFFYSKSLNIETLNILQERRLNFCTLPVMECAAGFSPPKRLAVKKVLCVKLTKTFYSS